MAITFTGLGQQMPYNPDANGDDFVGVDDVLGVLGLYDTALMQPDLQCDYETTDLEGFMAGIISGSFVLDSLYVEYLISDSVLIYLPECPDPVYVETTLERSYMYRSSESISVNLFANNNPIWGSLDLYGYSRYFWVNYNENSGSYSFSLWDHEVEDLFPWSQITSWSAYLPYPGGWGLNEDGMQADWSGWASYCQSLRVIPFWHEAE